MEFRDKLLSSEIRHITDLVNVLSYELVIIHDFMEQQFGKGFKVFRERHLLSAEVGVETVESKSTKERPSNVRRNMNVTDDPVVREDVSDAPPEMPEGQMQVDEDETNVGDSDDDDFSIGLEQDSNNSSGEDQTWPNKVEVGGRKSIWTKFDCKKLPGGRKIVKCRKCKQQVSAVAKRLERHYQHCVLGNKDYKITVTESSSGEPIQRGRKPLSTVWTHFNKNVNARGQTVVTCKFCDRKVSNHATRLTKHLQNCSKSSVHL